MTEHLTRIAEAQDAGLNIDLDTLERMATWREDLTERIARTQLIFELHDTETDFSQLVAEVEAFKRVCRGLMWSPSP
jgi:hypothetical protein